MVENNGKIYFCIDLKCFYASVECVERGLDPFKSNLVVADPSRGNGAICLAISPSMKALGIKNRCRIFEIPKNVEYIVAKPRMKKYIEYSAKIYEIYLKYFDKKDIQPYSIDEMFFDATSYLKMNKVGIKQFAKIILDDILAQTGVTATCGIGTNLFLAKVSLDILAKHQKDNIAFLTEQTFKQTLWHHTPLTDFWQIGKGTENRLSKFAIHDMYGIAHADENLLYKEFGVNAKILIDHSKGIEPITIEQIKNYQPHSRSLSQSQILFEDYSKQNARLVLTEMVDALSLELIKQKKVCGKVSVGVHYSKEVVPPTGMSHKMPIKTNVFSVLKAEILSLYDQTTYADQPIRKLSISFDEVLDQNFEQLDLLTNREKIIKERKGQVAVNSIKDKFGKNSIMRGISLEKGATQKLRNNFVTPVGKKIEDLEREKIFMPFDALKGFRQALAQKECETESQHDLTEEKQVELSLIISKIKKRDFVRVEFYNLDKYVQLTGYAEQIDFTLKYIVVEKQKILFNQISAIEKLS